MKTIKQIIYFVCLIPFGLVILAAWLIHNMAIRAVHFMEWLEGPEPCPNCGCSKCCESEMCYPSYFPKGNQ